MRINKPIYKQGNSYLLNSKKFSYIKVKKNDVLLDEIKYF